MSDLLLPGNPRRQLEMLPVLRWWLLGGLSLAVLSAPTFLAIPLPLAPLVAVLLLLAAFNFFVQRRKAEGDCSAPELAVQLVVDLTGMAVLLYLSGGATNPLISLLLLPVTVAALTLPARWVAGIVVIAVGAYSFLMIFSLPLPVTDVARATRLHLGGMWLTFVVSALLMAWFFTRMTMSIRQRDAQLAMAREEALRDAQIIALGQLAAGAAHELGTPLATMSILAGEMTRDVRLPEEAREDAVVLANQIGVCKEILDRLTYQAGVQRTAGSAAMLVSEWLLALLARWRNLWPQATCRLAVQTGDDEPCLVPGGMLEQAIFNLLNNSARIAPLGLVLEVAWNADSIRITLVDQGPGFSPELLVRGGVEPLGAHAAGSGLGLWLTSSAVSRLGGKLLLANVAGGARATIELPRAERFERDKCK